jgi:purine-binding chemotaxis protein CheW
MSESFQTATDQIVEFTLDELSFALSLPAVEKVIHAVEIRHLPKAPEIITGIINVKGQIIPVADIRKRFGLGAREIDPDNRLIIADTGKRQVAILVDTVTGIMDLAPGQLSVAKETLPFSEHIRGVAKVDNGLILIFDLDRFLSLDEEKELDQALKTKDNES